MRSDKREDEVGTALSLYGVPIRDEVRRSILKTKLPKPWRKPMYVERLGLHYDVFCAAAYNLHFHLGLSVEDIADGMGVQVDAVESALDVQARHLEKAGATCPTCGDDMDPVWNHSGYCCSKCDPRTQKGLDSSEEG